MICDRYWRDGIMLAERGEPDPHRETCAACRREHAARCEIVAALPLVAATTSGDPAWEARVWSRIARLGSQREQRRRWRQGGALAAAIAVVLLWWLVARGVQTGERRPRIEFVPGEIAMRSTRPSGSGVVGDRVRVLVGPGEEARIYRADDLVLRCRAGASGGGCRSDARGLVAETLLATSGNYRLVIIRSATAEPAGRLARDLDAVLAAGGDYQVTELSIH